jgi:hypothetical protein
MLQVAADVGKKVRLLKVGLPVNVQEAVLLVNLNVLLPAVNVPDEEVISPAILIFTVLPL